MLFLLSPAKSLDYDTPTPGVPHTQPLFVKQAEPLIKALCKKSWRQVSKLMDLSQALSELNVARYQGSPRFQCNNWRFASPDLCNSLVCRFLCASR